MSYTIDGIKLLEFRRNGPQVFLTVSNSNAGMYLQCYISGELFSFQNKLEAKWRAALPLVRSEDTVSFIAVAKELRSTNIWQEVFSAYKKSRVQVELMTNMTGRLPGDKFNVFLAAEGQDLQLVHSVLVSDNDTISGFGISFDHAFGFDSLGVPGFSSCFGYGEFGFDCAKLEYISEPLAGGDYQLRLSVSNVHENHTIIAEQNFTINDNLANLANNISLADIDEDNKTFSIQINA